MLDSVLHLLQLQQADFDQFWKTKKSRFILDFFYDMLLAICSTFLVPGFLTDMIDSIFCDCRSAIDAIRSSAFDKSVSVSTIFGLTSSFGSGIFGLSAILEVGALNSGSCGFVFGNDGD